jgi:hypothetical protein
MAGRLSTPASSDKQHFVYTSNTKSEPDWAEHARDHAIEYLHRFAMNPGVEKVVRFTRQEPAN